MSRAAEIAIVDDDKGIREALQGLVSSHGYHVNCFSSAQEFLQAPCREKIACLILDIQMPGITGLELQELLKSDPNRPSIIFVTSYGEGVIREKAMAGGALAVFSKPVDDQKLIDFIELALKSKA